MARAQTATRSVAITRDDRDACYAEAIAFAKGVLGEGEGYLNPQARLGQLSEYEWSKLASNMVSGWICQRSRQLTDERRSDDSFFLSTGEIPEAAELGEVAAILPSLGNFVGKMGLTDKPITAWSKQEILHFVWVATEALADARAQKNERPTDPRAEDSLTEQENMMMAG